MLQDVVPFKEFASKKFPGIVGRAILQFIGVLEKALGIRTVIDADEVPYGKTELSDLFFIASSLKKVGTLTSYSQSIAPPDEPRIFKWQARYGTENAGGMSAHSDRNALTAALAECVERKIWADKTDFFKKPFTASTSEMKDTAHISPERFAGLTEKQRTEKDFLKMQPINTYLWIRGYSLVQNKPIYIPAQIVSRVHGIAIKKNKSEPLLRPIITTGLATGQTRKNALLSGALEVIERDAFMVTWLNQITPSHISTDELLKSETLDALLSKCKRYRLDVDFVRLMTDAPTYVIGAVVSDGANMPPIAIGMSAHQDASRAAEKALLEALRARVNTRNRLEKFRERAYKPVETISQGERSMYWAVDDRSKQLSFLTAGPLQALDDEAWDDDTTEEHLERIIEWCRKKKYELAEIDMTNSAANTTPWCVTFVVIPEMQPLHQNEDLPCIGGARLKDIPKQFRHEPRAEPFVAAPHPFV
ncbi:MAG: hypothetical protein G01um10148_723 [Parcubacteria group bacterium Gr01-1014_8]|nr:MAG: hypothetical protein G01um10148_723 [Parcubacteria group bacterium Gr01-1014_8]